MKPSRLLRIAQVLSSRGEGGMELAPLLLAHGLKMKGQEVTVWADPGTFTGRKAAQQGLPLRPFRFKGHFHPNAVLELRKIVRREAPDLIHLHHARDLWSVVPALRMEGWTGPLLLSKHVASAVRKKDPLHRWLYRRLDGILACSDFIRENVRETCPIDPEKVETAYAPVNLHRFRPDPAAGRKHRKAWGWERMEVIGMVARLTPGKGHEAFLRMAARLLKDRPKARFRVAGAYSSDEEWFYQRLLALRRELGLEQAVAYDGRIEDVPGFLSGMDLAVHMADAESFGMAVAEAMACGKPAVVRRGGGVAEILEDSRGRTRGGIVLEGDDPETWAGSLSGLLKSKALMAKFRGESRKMVLRFGLDRWVDDHLKRYGTLLKGRTPVPLPPDAGGADPKHRKAPRAAFPIQP